MDARDKEKLMDFLLDLLCFTVPLYNRQILDTHLFQQRFLLLVAQLSEQELKQKSWLRIAL